MIISIVQIRRISSASATINDKTRLNGTMMRRRMALESTGGNDSETRNERALYRVIFGLNTQ